MKRAVALLSVAALLAAAAAAGRQDPPGMVRAARLIELGSPGEEHALLAKLAGSWRQIYRVRLSPGGTYTTSAGSSSARAILGGRQLMESKRYSVNGLSIEALLSLGFDNRKGEYTALWTDSASTWWGSARGRETAPGRLELAGVLDDVDGERPCRLVVSGIGGDEVKYELFDNFEGQETLVVECTSVRR